MGLNFDRFRHTQTELQRSHFGPEGDLRGRPCERAVPRESGLRPKASNAPAIDEGFKDQGLILIALGPAPLKPVRPLFMVPGPTVEALARHWGALPALSACSARKAAKVGPVEAAIVGVAAALARETRA
jgi:hypothetical protein